MAPCKVFLHGSRAVRIQFVDYFQVIGDRIFREYNAQTVSDLRTFAVESDKGVTNFTFLLYFSHRDIVVSARTGHGRNKGPFNERIAVDVV